MRTPRPTSDTRINVANLSLQGLVECRQLRSRAPSTSSTIVLNNNGQTSGQITAQAAFANAISMLNTQSGDRYLFSGRATDTPRRHRPTTCSTASGPRRV